MENIYRQTFQINAVHSDCFGRAKPSSLLYFAQEAAGGHCRELSLDWDTLAQRGLFWAILRYRVQISRLPVSGETITVETWPMPTTRSAFPRSTVAYDADGKELFRLIGLWVLMDRENRTMLLPGKSGIDLPGVVRGNELAPPSSVLPVPLSNQDVRRVGYCELDRNGHMNNTYYMNWIDDLLPAAFHQSHPATEFVICYLSEAREGEEITLNWQLLDGPVLQVDGHRSQGETGGKQTRVFSAKVVF
jgi:acyl-ACP thioesterase